MQNTIITMLLIGTIATTLISCTSILPSDDRARVLALGNEQSLFGTQIKNSNIWPRISSAEELRWIDCHYFLNAIGGYTSQVIIQADNLIYEIYVFNKDVC